MESNLNQEILELIVGSLEMIFGVCMIQILWITLPLLQNMKLCDKLIWTIWARMKESMLSMP